MLCGPTKFWDQRYELFIPPTGSSHMWAYKSATWVTGKGLKVGLQGKMPCKQTLELASLQRTENCTSTMVQTGHSPCWEGHLWGQPCYLSLHRRHMTVQHEAHVPALHHWNPREGPKEGGLLNNSGQLDLLGKRRLSKHAVGPAPKQAEQNREQPAHWEHLAHTFPEVMQLVPVYKE